MPNNLDFSLIASSVRPHLWEAFFKSLEGTKASYEVVFAGNLVATPSYPKLRYIQTGNIKPAQCYEIARRQAKGIFIMWVADDCEFTPNALDLILEFAWGLPNNTVISVKTNEDGKHNDLDDHRFFSENKNTPLMAPLGVMRTRDLSWIGGFDRRYVCGQYENDVVMRVLAKGGKVVKFEDACVNIEHLKKHGASTPFWKGYDHDRKILEDTWVVGGYKPLDRPLKVFQPTEDCPIRLYYPIVNREVLKYPQLPFEPYVGDDILTVSQSHKGIWE